MSRNLKRAASVLLWLACVAALAWYVWWVRRDDPGLTASLNSLVNDYRRIIVLMEGVDALDESGRARARGVGRRIFWNKQETVERLTGHLRENKYSVRQTVRFLSGGSLHDADKLALLDVFEQIADAGREPELVRATLDELQSIQNAYREEVARIFSALGTRGGAATRERWEAYIQFLRTLTSRERILAEHPGVLDEEPGAATRGARAVEIFGHEFAPKTVALTFDDGPHPRYTEQVAALLRKYGVRACFFELGRNIGTVKPGGSVELSRNAEIARRLLAGGHVLANHSYSHRQMSKLTPEEHAAEIGHTNLLLTKVSGQKPLLFRPPYGSRNSSVLEKLSSEGLQNVMWTIDSLDWADPVPESIALRVLKALSLQQKGIVLFHDIHKQSVLALPSVIEELQRQGYTFLTFDKGRFTQAAAPPLVSRAPAPPVPAPAPSNKFYRQSWAVIIGINDYQSWPKLKHSVNDADAVERELTVRFGFPRENVIKLIDGSATRQRILQVLGDDLADAGRVKREDRVFFFFAGHGATRTMPDGRQAGFIVPVDADRANFYSTAISMSAIREAADLIPARHVYFVMDSCYSGLALTRAAGVFSRDQSYLEEVTRRTARQILTAGGAEQQVADDGPNGHSVFTWALLQGLDGKADLDANGVITASELGAYVSPVVTSFSRQTPAVGNLPGSEGGEFIFELQPESLSAATQQLEGKALDLNARLAALERQIQERQTELLRLQQSIQAETAKLQAVGKGAEVRVLARASGRSAYELDRMALRAYREKNYDEAEKLLLEAVRLKPRDATLLNNLGFVYYRMGRYEAALESLKKTLALEPRRKEAHGNIADAYAKLGRTAEARHHYAEYLALYPSSPRTEEVRRIVAGLR
jgi:peptidoglycan/xylan/chitin deacetylase (PgdA/CDA1 family)/uncharacterized caspase-like protein